MPVATILIVVLLVLILGGVAPIHAWSQGWGYGPSGALGVILLVVLALLLLGRL